MRDKFQEIVAQLYATINYSIVSVMKFLLTTYGYIGFRVYVREIAVREKVVNTTKYMKLNRATKA